MRGLNNLRRRAKSLFDQRRPAVTAAEIAGTYALIGLLWVWLSAEFSVALFDPHGILEVQIIRGVILVIATGAAICLLIYRYNRHLRDVATELRESSARADTYFDATVEAVVNVDANGRIVRVNPRAEALFGYSKAEMVGELVEMLIPQHLRQRHIRHRIEYFKAPRSRPMGMGMNLVGLRKDGSEIPVEVSLNLLETEKGKLVSCFITDISERLAIEREARMSQMSAILGAMAGGVVHELNNPIGIIMSRTELMLAEWQDHHLPAQLREDVEVIHRNAQRIGRISQGLLGMVREPSKEHRLVSLNDIVDDGVQLVRRQFAKDRILIETALDRGLAPILGDPGALEQVLLNLLVNAREAMPDGGRIRIATGAAKGRPGWLFLSVSDTGCGIQPGTLPKLFTPFFTTKAGGTGLGLWISRRIITEHGGSIDVFAESAQGVTWVILLPRAETEFSPGAGLQPAQRPGQSAFPSALGSQSFRRS